MIARCSLDRVNGVLGINYTMLKDRTLNLPRKIKLKVNDEGKN